MSHNPYSWKRVGFRTTRPDRVLKGDNCSSVVNLGGVVVGITGCVDTGASVPWLVQAPFALLEGFAAAIVSGGRFAVGSLGPLVSFCDGSISRRWWRLQVMVLPPSLRIWYDRLLSFVVTVPLNYVLVFLFSTRTGLPTKNG